MGLNVAVLGASDKVARTSYRALHQLQAKGHKPYLVHPSLKEIEGIKVFAKLTDIKDPIHTLTVYLSPDNFLKVLNDVVKLNPKRVIFNPGSETLSSSTLEAKGIKTLEACTLVMLSIGQFED